MARTVPGRSYIETLVIVGDYDTARRCAWGYEGAEREELLTLVAKAEVAALIAAGNIKQAGELVEGLPSGAVRLAAETVLINAHIRNTLAAAGL